MIQGRQTALESEF